MKNISKILILIICVSMMGLISCSDDNSRANAKLIVEKITGKDLEGTEGSTVIYSDVETGGSIYNDNAVATIKVANLNPDDENKPSVYQNVTLDQIDIKYTRTDRTNAAQGRDVPFGFSQAIPMEIPFGVTVDVPFQIITHVAKLESPLLELKQLGQEKILKLEAHVTFYARDGAGNRLPPIEYVVSVWCANFADPETTD